MPKRESQIDTDVSNETKGKITKTYESSSDSDVSTRPERTATIEKPLKTVEDNDLYVIDTVGREISEESDNGVIVEESVDDSKGRDDYRHRFPEDRDREFRDGDWLCTKCDAHNFAKRISCFSCGEHGGGKGDYGGGRPEMRDGDWTCGSCGKHNFARRVACFGCRAPRGGHGGYGGHGSHYGGAPYGGNYGGYSGGHPVGRYNNYHGDYHHDGGYGGHGGYGAHGGHGGYSHGGHGGYGYADHGSHHRSSRDDHPFRDGDWNCDECGKHNFASRRECFVCRAPKRGGYGGRMDFGRGEDRGSSFRYERREGDWDCSSCHKSNFAFRTECFSCRAPR
eukprot:TRINITY_DN12418_c0_g1_i1.p1 TRINITY_DN12418_c0_g1~~TRINITY_DN12418_c0_g1_i1.p1  ORF type:complete len:349 (+),score=59.05 TRINITY_DN12418_c0_g1_i1:37-1047(+)